MQPLTIVKIGGRLLDDPDKLEHALFSFSRIKSPKILVHGGGTQSNELIKTLGIAPDSTKEPPETNGRTLEIIFMVYAGLLNKKVVSRLQSLGCDAIGLTGADGNTILAKKQKMGPINFGLTGDIKKVYTPFIESLLKDSLTPVFCTITHNGKGQLLSANADTIATSLASALTSQYDVTLKYCFEKKGVLSNPTDDDSVVKTLSKREFNKYKKGGVFNDSMITKLQNAFQAKKAKVNHVFICGVSGIDEGSAFTGTEII